MSIGSEIAIIQASIAKKQTIKALSSEIFVGFISALAADKQQRRIDYESIAQESVMAAQALMKEWEELEKGGFDV